MPLGGLDGGGGEMPYRQRLSPRPAPGTTPFQLVRAEVRLTGLDACEMSYALLSAFPRSAVGGQRRGRMKAVAACMP